MCSFPVIIASKNKLTLEFLEQMLARYCGKFLQQEYDKYYRKNIPTAREKVVKLAAMELYRKLVDGGVVWVGMDDYEWEYEHLKNKYGFNEIFPNIKGKEFKYFYPGKAISNWLLNIKIEDNDLNLYIGEVEV